MPSVLSHNLSAGSAWVQLAQHMTFSVSTLLTRLPMWSIAYGRPQANASWISQPGLVGLLGT